MARRSVTPKQWRAIAVVAGCMLVTGCTKVTYFVVSNRTDGEIYVKYSYVKPGESCLLRDEPPAMILLDSIRWWKAIPDDSPTVTYGFHPETCSMDVTLQPGQAVRIAFGYNYTGPGSGWSILRDLELAIGSPAGGVTLSGDELERSFSKRSRAIYELAYTSDGVGEPR